MTTSERREEIARTIAVAAFGPTRYRCVSEYENVLVERVTDALLARFPVLAGVTDEAVEAGARALFRHEHDVWEWPDVPSAHEACRDATRAVLSAVLGASQGPRPGDGSEL